CRWVRRECNGVEVIVRGAVTHSPGVTEQEIEPPKVCERAAEIGADDAEPALRPIEREVRCPGAVPSLTIELAGHLCDLSGTVGAQRMRLEHVQAVGPDPPFRDAEIRMPVLHDRSTVLVDDHLEIAVGSRAEVRLNDATGSRA